MSEVLDAFKDLRDYTACNNCVYQKEKECVKGNFCIWNDIEKELKGKEELEKAFDTLSKDYEKVMKELSKEIEKNRALNEILALHDKWLGNEMSDFEFFTLLSEVKDKYGLSKEVLL